MKLVNYQIPSCQRGAASIGIVFVIFLLLLYVLSTSLGVSGAVSQDASTSTQRLQAFFLAESGLERASQQFTKGLVCDASSNQTLTVTGKGTFELKYMGATNFDGTSCPVAVCGSAYCRVRSTGKSFAADTAVTVNARTTEALLIQKSVNASGSKALTSVTVNGNPHFTINNTVTPGDNRLYVLSILWTGTAAKPGKVTGVQYAGVNMSTPFATNPTTTEGTSTYGVQIYYLLNPPLGTSTVDVAFDASPAGVAIGNINLDGVDPTNPIASSAAITPLAPVESITLPVSLPANGLVLDVLSRNNGGNVTGPSCDPLSSDKLFSGNANNVSGESWYCGPAGATSSSFPMGYTFSQAKAAAYALVTVRADSSNGSGSRVRFPGSGVFKWHELISSPP
jgi:hypothetical protein